MEEQGDLHSGGDQTEGSACFPPRRPVARTPAPCVPAPWRPKAAHRGMHVSCRDPGVWPGTARVRESAWAPKEPPGNPGVWT